MFMTSDKVFDSKFPDHIRRQWTAWTAYCYWVTV